jgi:transcriptional regulator with XRE-family HTH domain
MTITDTATTAKTPPLTELVAEEIRALLARRRISGRELARRMGASYSWVNFRLTGAQPIDLNDLQRIADVLDVEVLDLLPTREGRVVTHAGAPRRQTTVP